MHKKVFGQVHAIDSDFLSSGEKQQAILNLYSKLIVAKRTSEKTLVVGIDEPEASLHISACFDQFEKLYELASSRCQVVFTAHWYGFIPAIGDGNMTNICVDPELQKRMVSHFESKKYFEQTKKKRKDSIDVELKGINDFIQSIVSGVTKDNPYNWLICEGSSDKIYLEYYLKDFVDSKKLRIVAVRGVGEIRRVYQNLKVIFDDDLISGSVNGKIVLLADTDPHLNINKEDVVKSKILFCKRLVKDAENIELVNVDCDLVTQADIESSMNGSIMYMALDSLKEDLPEIKSFLGSCAEDDKCVAFSFDWKTSQIDKMHQFFSKKENKPIVAQRYVDCLKTEVLNGKKIYIPEWINYLKKLWT